MIFKPYQKIFSLLSVLILLVAVAGCSENDGKATDKTKNVADVTQSTKEQIVSQRALERWQAMIAMDWEKAYGYFSAGSRQLLSFNAFQSHMLAAPMVRRKAEIKSIKCEEALCDVNVELTYIYMGTMDAMRGQESKSIIKEKWLLSDAQWWYVDVGSPKGLL